MELNIAPTPTYAIQDFELISDLPSALPRQGLFFSSLGSKQAIHQPFVGKGGISTKVRSLRGIYGKDLVPTPEVKSVSSVFCRHLSTRAIKGWTDRGFCPEKLGLYSHHPHPKCLSHGKLLF